MKTAKEVGGSVRRSGRRKVVGAALGLTAAISVGGLMLSNSAHAAFLGTVAFDVSAPDGDYVSAGREKAMPACKAQYPQTQSVDLIASMGSEPENTYYQTWACIDTP